jgi:hypothetical protein
MVFALIAIIIVASFLIWNYRSQTSTDKLRNLLAQKKWKEANIETSRLILYVIELNVRGKFSLTRNSYEEEELDLVPCSILDEIDRLWITSTNGHFGFSVQMRIYEDCFKETNFNSPFRSQSTGNIDFIKFSDANFSFDPPEQCRDSSIRLLIEKLQWYDYDPSYHPSALLRYVENFRYNLNAPKGHLPFLFYYTEDTSFNRNVNWVQMRYMARLWNRLQICRR